MVGGMVLMPLFGAAEGLTLKGQILLLRPLGSGKIDFNYMWHIYMYIPLM